jgi:hypothetical protein
MTTGATGQLGLALPVQGELSGTWGDTVNNGLTQYINIAIAGTLTLTDDGAVTLANTTGDASASNVTSTLTGAGTVTAQFAIVRVTGTLTTAKVVTAPSYSKTYTVVNAATGGIVTFKASGQTGVSVAVGETAFVYFNGTDYVKVVGTATAGAAGGSNTQVQYNNAGVLAGSSAFTFVGGTTVTMANDASISGLTVGKGAGAVSTNTAVGASALSSNTTGDFNTAIGYAALNASTALVGVAGNTAIGGLALTTNTSGESNTGVGFSALRFTTTGSFNSSLGRNALRQNTTGSYSVAVGNDALYTSTTGSNNTAVGYGAGYNNTTGASNVAVGREALNANTTASNNTAVGYQAGYTGTTATQVVAIGSGALYANTVNYGTAVGFNALNANQTGAANAAFGAYALSTNTTGAGNSAFGAFGFGLSDSALQANTTGSNNSAFGLGALGKNTTASNNTAVGYQAGYTNQTGTANAFFGTNAGYTATGNRNTFIGPYVGYSVTTGAGNVFIGNGGSNNSAGSGYDMTSGDNNIIVGGFTGNQDGLDIRTSSAYAVISDGLGRRQLSMYKGGTVALDSAVPVAGTGITFPATQSASTNANTLDDYEEGTWTPALTCGTSGTITLTSPTNSMKYTKVGQVVTLTGLLDVSSVSLPVGDLRLTGIPFTINATNGGTSGGVAYVYAGLATSAHSSVQLSINSSDTQLYIRGYLNGAQIITFSNNIQAGTGIQVFAQYIVN